jgi:hypothetical protein
MTEGVEGGALFAGGGARAGGFLGVSSIYDGTVGGAVVTIGDD